MNFGGMEVLAYLIGGQAFGKRKKLASTSERIIKG